MLPQPVIDITATAAAIPNANNLFFFIFPILSNLQISLFLHDVLFPFRWTPDIGYNFIVTLYILLYNLSINFYFVILYLSIFHNNKLIFWIHYPIH